MIGLDQRPALKNWITQDGAYDEGIDVGSSLDVSRKDPGESEVRDPRSVPGPG